MSTTETAIVIGGGIAGPVTATALRKAGIAARVYEPYPGPTFGIRSRLALEPDYTGMIGFGAMIDNDFGIPSETMVFAFGQKAYYLYASVDDNKVMWGANLPHKEYLSLTQARAIPAERWLAILRETYAEDTP